jgi:hypothetical protein
MCAIKIVRTTRLNGIKVAVGELKENQIDNVTSQGDRVTN